MIIREEDAITSAEKFVAEFEGALESVQKAVGNLTPTERLRVSTKNMKDAVERGDLRAYVLSAQQGPKKISTAQATIDGLNRIIAGGDIEAFMKRAKGLDVGGMASLNNWDDLDRVEYSIKNYLRAMTGRAGEELDNMAALAAGRLAGKNIAEIESLQNNPIDAEDLDGNTKRVDRYRGGDALTWTDDLGPHRISITSYGSVGYSLDGQMSARRPESRGGDPDRPPLSAKEARETMRRMHGRTMALMAALGKKSYVFVGAGPSHNRLYEAAVRRWGVPRGYTGYHFKSPGGDTIQFQFLKDRKLPVGGLLQQISPNNRYFGELSRGFFAKPISAQEATEVRLARDAVARTFNGAEYWRGDYVRDVDGQLQQVDGHWVKKPTRTGAAAAVKVSPRAKIKIPVKAPGIIGAAANILGFFKEDLEPVAKADRFPQTSILQQIRLTQKAMEAAIKNSDLKAYIVAARLSPQAVTDGAAMMRGLNRILDEGDFYEMMRKLNLSSSLRNSLNASMSNEYFEGAYLATRDVLTSLTGKASTAVDDMAAVAAAKMTIDVSSFRQSGGTWLAEWDTPVGTGLASIDEMGEAGWSLEGRMGVRTPADPANTGKLKADFRQTKAIVEGAQRRLLAGMAGLKQSWYNFSGATEAHDKLYEAGLKRHGVPRGYVAYAQQYGKQRPHFWIVKKEHLKDFADFLDDLGPMGEGWGPASEELREIKSNRTFGELGRKTLTAAQTAEQAKFVQEAKQMAKPGVGDRYWREQHMRNVQGQVQDVDGAWVKKPVRGAVRPVTGARLRGVKIKAPGALGAAATILGFFKSEAIHGA